VPKTDVFCTPIAAGALFSVSPISLLVACRYQAIGVRT